MRTKPPLALRTPLRQYNSYQLAVINTPKIDTQCTNLIPGDSICLGYLGEDCTETYVVQTDDTCEGITGQAGLNSTILTLNNPQIDQDCSNLYIGEVCPQSRQRTHRILISYCIQQVLCTAKSVQVPPAPASGKPIAPTTAKPATPKATNDDDDDDLPYCDEL